MSSDGDAGESVTKRRSGHWDERGSSTLRTWQGKVGLLTVLVDRGSGRSSLGRLGLAVDR